MTKDQEKAAGSQEKSKSQLRAERREKQEAQRAAKAAKKPNEPAPKATKSQDKDKVKAQQPAAATAPKSVTFKENAQTVYYSEQDTPGDVGRAHSPQPNNLPSMSNSCGDHAKSFTEHPKAAVPQRQSMDLPVPTGKQQAPIHGAFHQLGLQMSSGSLLGSDAQCVATVEAFKRLITEYHPPAGKSFSREIENSMKPCITFIAAGKPLPPSLASLVKQLKFHLTTWHDKLGSASEDEVRTNLLQWLDDFVEHKITLSTASICLTVSEKLRSFKDKPIILTYSYSSLVEEILLNSFKNGVKFEVVIVDSLPTKHGQILVRSLVNLGIRCRYVLINGLTHVINETNLVLLGADGLLANGNVVCSLGGSQVAMVAKVKNIPVLIACQTYKFCEKVQTGTLESGWPNNEVMPSDFVTGVVTELRTLPCSAVPAVLRVKQLF